MVAAALAACIAPAAELHLFHTISLRNETEMRIAILSGADAAIAAFCGTEDCPLSESACDFSRAHVD